MTSKLIATMYRCKIDGTLRRDPNKPCRTCRQVSPCIKCDVTKVTVR